MGETMDINDLQKMSKGSAGYTEGTGKGFGCKRCAMNRNGKCGFMFPSDNKIKPDGGCCNLWTSTGQGAEPWLGRLVKHQMGYIETTPGQKIECKECTYWQNGTCKIVAGPIKATASCNYWISKNKPTRQF